jgi:hypothetical protein
LTYLFRGSGWLISGEGTMFINEFSEEDVIKESNDIFKRLGVEFDEKGYLKKRK